MPANYLLVSRKFSLGLFFHTLSVINKGQAVMRLCKVRINPNRLLERNRSLVQYLALRVSAAQVKVHFRIVRVYLNGLLQRADGLIKRPFIRIGVLDVVVGGRCLLYLGKGNVKHPLVGVSLTEPVMRIGITRFQLDDCGKFYDGIVEKPFAGINNTQGRNVLSRFWVQFLSLF